MSREGDGGGANNAAAIPNPTMVWYGSKEYSTCQNELTKLTKPWRGIDRWCLNSSWRSGS